MKRLEIANNFVDNYRKEVKTAYRPSYHIIPPIGWLNDPNGFSYYAGEYHLFYQYHPYFSKWGPMHWAHLKSKDLIRWEWLPIALAPDEHYDKDGCFSGTAIVDSGRHVLMYTSQLYPETADTTIYKQQQCMAYSYDGINYIKSKNNPVITSDMVPLSGDKQDFRDPKIIKTGDTWYSLIANNNNDGSGQILVYRSKDLEKWTYHGILCQSKNKVGKMWECPDIISVDGHDLLTISPMFLSQRGEEFNNIHSSVYAIGNLDINKPEFCFNEFHEIDFGLDFYAPQTVKTLDGKIIMLGWMQTWERNYPTEDMKHGWAGALTLPRELSVKKGKLVQKPANELRAYRENNVNIMDIDIDGRTIFEGVIGDQIELDLVVDMKKSHSFKMELFKSKNESVDLIYTRAKSSFTFSRANTNTSISGLEDHQVESRTFTVESDGKIRLQVFLDVSTVEVFINDGQYVCSNTVFPVERGKGIEFISDGIVKIETLNKWDIRL